MKGLSDRSKQFKYMGSEEGSQKVKVKRSLFLSVCFKTRAK